jgi:hypothetical protein
VEVSNQAGGWGVVHGFDTTLGNQRATLELGPGLAIDAAGRVLLLPHAASVGVRELIERSRAQSSGGTRTNGRSNGHGAFDDCEVDDPDQEEPGSAFPVSLYLISIAHVEALCGEEDVYGKLCEDACVTSSERPYRLEGVVLRASPLSLGPGTCDASWLGSRHVRSRVASAYFAAERRRLGRTMSGTRLRQELWCLGARTEPGTDVPLAVVAVNGDVVEFLDAWTARRERMEAPARRYWAWQMMMRPWNVYLAQILQFQCQLRGLLAGGPRPGEPDDPCSDQHRVLRATRQLLDRVEAQQPEPVLSSGPSAGGGTAFDQDFLVRAAELRREVAAVLESPDTPRQTRVLIDGGIVELPPAGYLPVVPGAATVNAQVRRLLGEGVDLRFCVVRPDFVAHALEEAQHMERICLLRGLDDPALREAVDVLVPDGELLPGARVSGLLFDTNLQLFLPQESGDRPDDEPEPDMEEQPTQRMRGVGRAEALPGGGGAFHFAGSAARAERELLAIFSDALDDASVEQPIVTPAPTSEGGSFGRIRTNVNAAASFTGRQLQLDVPLHAWASLRCERDPFDVPQGEATRLTGELVAAVVASVGSVAIDISLDGTFFVLEPTRTVGQLRRVRGRILRARVSLTPVVNGSEAASQTTRVTLDVDLELRRTSDGETELALVLRHTDGVTIRLRTSWSGSPLGVEARASFTPIWYERRRDEAWNALNAGDRVRATDLVNQLRACVGLQPITPDQVQEELHRLEDTLRGRTPSDQCAAPDERLGRASLREEPDLAAAEHPLHRQALTTIARVEQALGQPGFRRTAERLLFPLEPAAREATVRAIRDWVLFHRRRSKRCVEVARVVAPRRRYRLHHGRAPAGVSAAEVRRMLRSILDRPRVDDPVDDLLTIEFGGTPSMLVTSEEAIVRALRSVETGDRLVLAAMGSEGEAGEDSLPAMEERLRQLVTVAATVTPLTEDAEVDVLPRVPAFLDTHSADGVMILVTTERRVETERLRVLTFRDQGVMDNALEVLRAGRMAGMLEEFAIELGEVEFEENRPVIVGDSLSPVVSAWRSQWQDLAVARAVVVSAARENTEVEGRRAQAERIANELGGQLTDGHERSDEDLYAGSAGLMLLEPGQGTPPPPPPQLRTARLVATRTVEGQGQNIAGREPDWTVRFDQDGTLAEAVPQEILTAIARLVPGISSVVLATRETSADSQAHTRLDAIFNVLHNAGMLRVAATGAPQASRDVRTRNQIASSLRLFDADGVTADDVIILDTFIIG